MKFQTTVSFSLNHKIDVLLTDRGVEWVKQHRPFWKVKKRKELKPYTMAEPNPTEKEECHYAVGVQAWDAAAALVEAGDARADIPRFFRPRWLLTVEVDL